MQNLVQRPFSGGELAPNLYGRADLARYTTALRTCRNFLVLRGGGLANRGGLQFLGEGGDMTEPITLYRWAFTAGDMSTLLELGDQYLRFWMNGARVTVSAVADYDVLESYDLGEVAKVATVHYVCIQAATPGDDPSDATFWYPLTEDIYELPTPWAAGAFNSPGRVRASQDEFEVTFTHPSAQGRVLRNLNVSGSGNPRWSLELLATVPGIEAPDNPAATVGAAGTLNPVYVVTAIAATTYEESLPSDAVTCLLAATPTPAAPNHIEWDTVSGAVEYRVYCDPLGNGTFGYIGTATGQLEYFDGGDEPDFLQTPPIARDPFSSSTNYPECCGYYQQRRILAMTSTTPAGVWASRVGHVDNFSIRSPLQDDDAVTLRLRAAELQVVRHIVPLPLLVILTNTSEWVLHGDGESGALTPSTINPRQHGYSGASRALPSVIANTCIFVQEGGTRVRALKIDQQVEGLGSVDLSVFASHLFDGYTIVRTEYQKDLGIVWALRSDGTLLGLTYLPEDDAYGWHRHDTDGVIEDICVVPEAGEDVLYLVVAREIDNDDMRYIERMAARPLTFTPTTLAASAVFVDAAITKDGASSVLVTGLDHLEGEEVYGLADGIPFGPFTVEDGEIELATAATVVHVGLRYTAQIEPLDLDVQGTGVRDKLKRIQSIGLVVHASGRGFYAGLTAATLYQYKAASYDVETIKSGYVESTLKTGFTEHGRFLLQHTEATPLTILQLIPRFDVGG